MRIYLAGPMRGIPEFNRPAFVAATEFLRSAGHTVYSPVEYNEEHGHDFTGHSGNLDEAEANGFNLRAALAAGLSWICEVADAVAVLPGWENSLGVTAELSAARALDLPVWKMRMDPSPDMIADVRPP